MATIVENISGNKALQLGGEEFVRKLTFGNAWNRIRIGIMCVLNGSANIAPPRRLVMGLCDGDQFTYQSASCLSFVGISWGPNAGGNWTYDGVGGTYGMYAAGSVSYVTSKINTTVTDTSTGNNATKYLKTGGSGTPHLLMVELIRSATPGTYSVRGYAPDGTDILSIPSFYNFMLSMEWEDTGNFTTYFERLAAANATGMSTNLDTLSLYWSLASPTIEITDVCVLRFY